MKRLEDRHEFSGGYAPPRNDLHPPPEAFGTAPKRFCTTANYIYFDLMVSYLIILTKIVKLPILWSQMIRSHHAGLENKYC